MTYLIIAHDDPGMEAKREELREAHAGLISPPQGKRLLASGTSLSEDGHPSQRRRVPSQYRGDLQQIYSI